MKNYKNSMDEVYAFEDDYIVNLEVFTPISEQEAEQLNEAARQKIFDSLSILEKRIMNYPSIGEQLDILYHQGYDGWKAVIKEVKDKYPKT